MFTKAVLFKSLHILSDIERIILDYFYRVTLTKSFEAPRRLKGLKQEIVNDKLRITTNDGIILETFNTMTISLVTLSHVEANIINGKLVSLYYYYTFTGTLVCKVLLLESGIYPELVSWSDKLPSHTCIIKSDNIAFTIL